MTKELNILILGQTGVGKSTFINGIANYMKFQTLNKAEATDPVFLVPASFELPVSNNEKRKIVVGYSTNEQVSDGVSSTQIPRRYCVSLGDSTICLIDTPGIGDTRGPEYDKLNCDNIIRHISGLKELHGICILLKPNEARLHDMFRFCITELLTRLHRSAVNNIVFCYTNARGTFYKSGDTSVPLTAFLRELKETREETRRRHCTFRRQPVLL